ncbi:MAG: hypothetical protein PHP73_03545 [Candidatus Omnitrophica bacterium]|nr:hypothetical protein [Candidatus Omnitrophota bacterium]
MNEALKEKNNKIIDYLGLFFIGILSLSYVLFYRNFAKLHIDLSFMGAPFFISDMVFLTCFFLFLLKQLIDRNNINIVSLLFCLCLGFLIIKTVFGYLYWGPLALRHAVLFFYPFFAIFTYVFYRSDFFAPRKCLILIFVFLSIFKFDIFFPYYALTCFILTAILVKDYPNRLVKSVLFLLLLLIFPYRPLFDIPRTFSVSNLSAGIFAAFGFLYILKIKKIYKIILFFIFISFIFYGGVKYGKPNELKSILSIDELVKRYNVNIENLRNKEDNFKASKLDIKLYNKDNAWVQKNNDYKYKITNKSPLISAIENNPAVGKTPNVKGYKISFFTKISRLVNEVRRDNVDFSNRGIDIPYINSLFRIFIWGDALDELIMQHPVFGFDFGKPFRARSLEILGWASGEWMRDGWVCLHNSYIDIVYRAGILGIIIIVYVFVTLFSLIKRSFQNRSLTGILLTGILINWFIAANFLEILEMPYTAIPLWSLFGLTFAYLFKNKTL